MIRFVFDEKKATQAAALLVKLAGGSMSRSRLLKLLYLADRKSLLSVGKPITGDKFCSMHMGPVLSRVYDFIKGQGTPPVWSQHFKPEGRHDVRLVKEDFETARLSEFETRLLSKITNQCCHLSDSELIDYVHKHCPEWQDPGPSSRPIEIEQILAACRTSNERITAIEEQAVVAGFMASLA
jgi:uncharacterized phage-associated protein